MTDVRQVQDDLRFVRVAVNRRFPGLDGYPAIYYASAIYVMIGYILLDINPIYANWFFVLGALALWPISVVFCKRATVQLGEIDQKRAIQGKLHWAFGIWGSILATVALEVLNPALRGPLGGQVMVILIGLTYFMWGVHRDRSFLWLGPIMMIGGVLVGLIPLWRWTCLGAVIALGLVAAGILAQRSIPRRAQA